MSKQKSWRRLRYITIGIIAFVFSINLILNLILKQQLVNFLVKNDSKYYTATVSEIDFSLLRKSISLTDVFIIPKKETLDSLKNNSSSKESYENITASEIRLSGIHFSSILLQRKIVVNTITFDDLIIHKFENSKIIEKKKQKKRINIDSIYLKKINGVLIENITFNNFQFESYDFAKKDTTFKSRPISFTSSGIKITSIGDRYFELRPAKDQFEIENIHLDLENTQYDFTLDKIAINFAEKYIRFTDVKFKPQIDKFKLAQTFKFNKPVYDVSAGDLTLYNFQLSKVIKGDGLFIDSLLISKLDLKIFNDKNNPFDLNKRPGLPHTGLKKMKFPLLVKKIVLENSDVLIETKLKDSELLMKIPISNIKAEISNITSVNLYRNNPLKVKVDAKLMKSSSAHLDASFILKDHQNMFYFSGTLGPTKMKIFDSAIFPVLGLKVLNGDLDHLSFSASANEIEANGKMTLLYHDLEATVYKNNAINDTNKFLSWTVNSLIKEDNPKKNKTAREVNLYVERTIYKGLGNYFWKTLQGGIIHTIAGGKQTTASKDKKRKLKKNQKK